MDFFDLQTGDTFIEDGYPEVWKVTANNAIERGMQGVNSICVGYLSEALDTGRLGETSFWGCSEPAYCPNVYRTESFYAPNKD